MFGLMVTLLAMLSLAGWGVFCGRIFGYKAPSLAMSSVIGLATVIFAGGLLNLLHVAHGLVLDLVLVVGAILFAILYRSQLKFWHSAEVTGYTLFVWLTAAGLWGGAAVSQLSPTAFNFHDDFEKYFTFPVRMLLTGTLAGNPLNALGSETLGGLAFLHGMVLNHFPITYINGVDALFGLLLCLLLPCGALPARPSFLPAVLCGMAVVFTINPQIINISASYTVCALLMAAMLLFCNVATDDATEAPPPAILYGLLLAALIALKTILLLYAAIVFVTFSVVIVLVARDVRGRVLWLARTAGATVLFLAPWIALYLPNYLHSGSLDTIQPVPPGTGELYIEPFSFFSMDPLYYGSSYLLYSLVVLFTLALSVIVFAVYRRRYGVMTFQGIALLAGGTAIVISYIVLLALGPQLNGYFHSLRYAIPLLTAGLPVLGNVAISVAAPIMNKWQRACVIVVIAVEVVVVGLFAANAVKRFQQGLDSGNVLAFSALASSSDYLAYNKEVLYGDRHAYIRKIQKVIPPGKPFLAWITTPYHFDYQRNTIYDAEHAGIGTPWAILPKVDYYVVESDGYAVVPQSTLYEDLRYPGTRERYVSRRCLSLMDTLAGLQSVAEELYNDGRIAVFRTVEQRP